MDKSQDNHGETRRDRRIQRKREEILAAATQIFAQKGFASTTTRDIADAADIGESTLYSYFDSKRAILLAILNETRSLFDTLLLGASGIATREALIDLVDRCLELAIARMPFTRTVLAEAWFDDDILKNFVMARLQQISQLLQDFIADEIKAGVLRPIDPALGARLALGMFFALVLPFVRGIEPPPQPEQRHALAEMMISLLLDGIRTREGELR
ncbi:MAG TPA: TetR/AcrR family transcriptional regulator [Aggregatilineales bacterium]|nr:TetR/AcrR family transcriptional regulator [Aggregatilineales bacterium]